MLLKRGDTVVYHDRDHVRWGPWEVIAVHRDHTTVLIDDHLSYEMPTKSLYRVFQSPLSD